jgi:hypothetical protein
LRFNVAAGVTSILGNLVLMALLSGSLHLPVVPANAVAVAILSLVNFVLADRWVFRKPGVACALVVAGLVPLPAAAAPPADALSRWQEYVARTEARLAAVSTREPCATPNGIAADGDTIDAGPATISHWRAAVVIPNTSLARLLDRLQHPGTPPPQADIVSSRVLARGDDSLRVAIRLTRSAIVTVTYDTEHEMAFHRLSPTLATARSVATRIEEVGGGDHGFLWRLHSYWRYEQSGSGVLVQRPVPAQTDRRPDRAAHRPRINRQDARSAARVLRVERELPRKHENTKHDLSSAFRGFVLSWRPIW